MTTTVFVSTRVARPAAEVYAFAADPRTLPRWAHGLGVEVDRVDGAWVVQTPGGPARVTFVPRNALGVVDHVVDTPTGEHVHVPLRVVPDGDDACEVVFMLRTAGMTPDEADRDRGLLQADLERLRDLAEAGEARAHLAQAGDTGGEDPAWAAATSREVVALSAWLDDANADRPAEAESWARIAKITEEAGEVVAAYIGLTGQNPRKGVTHTRDDVQDELLDVVVTALAALEHLRGHDARSLGLLRERLARTLVRAGLRDDDAPPVGRPVGGDGPA